MIFRKEQTMRETELLIPASSLEVLKVAVTYGADAVYIGGEMFGLRAKARNFSMEEISEGIEYAHERGAKVYITANIVARNEDLPGVREYFRELKKIGPDALIISDPGVFAIAKEEVPEIDIHISTQANSTNYGTYRFWYDQGAIRVVSARELSLKEIKEIRENIPEDMEIESFIHGAMCIAHSGRCLLSSYFTGRSANLGACTHPCRWKYHVMEESRPGEYLPVEENERGTYIFNSKDLCMIEYIPEILDAGIDSLKIEGRMKTALYVAAVARTYRQAIDDYKKSPELYASRMEYYREEIAKCTYRQFTTGFYFGKTDEKAQIYDQNTYVKEYTYIGIVEGHNEEGHAYLMQRNKFSVGETVEVMNPNGENLLLTVKGIRDEDGNAMEAAPHPKQMLYVDFGQEIETGWLIRRKED
jgi:putative protease